jgi:hypothetical protein
MWLAAVGAPVPAGDKGKLMVGILPVAHFCSGHVYFVQRLQDYLQIKPFAVHATFQFSGTPGKKHRFREDLLWDEKFEYFQSLGELRVWGGLTCGREAKTKGVTNNHIPFTTQQEKCVMRQL